jgi:hypothetical protein
MGNVMTSNVASITSIELRDAWANYHATLDEMRTLMETTPRYQQTPQHRAKAFHTLMEMQAMAYNFVIAPRMSHPRIYFQSGWQTDLYTLGQNCQDLLYGVIFLDGRQTYKLTGRMGDLAVFLLQVQNGIFGEQGVKVVGNYDLPIGSATRAHWISNASANCLKIFTMPTSLTKRPSRTAFAARHYSSAT